MTNNKCKLQTSEIKSPGIFLRTKQQMTNNKWCFHLLFVISCLVLREISFLRMWTAGNVKVSKKLLSNWKSWIFNYNVKWLTTLRTIQQMTNRKWKLNLLSRNCRHISENQTTNDTQQIETWYIFLRPKQQM